MHFRQQTHADVRQPLCESGWVVRQRMGLQQSLRADDGNAVVGSLTKIRSRIRIRSMKEESRGIPPTPTRNPNPNLSSQEPLFDHEKLEVYQEAIAFCAWAGELIEKL